MLKTIKAHNFLSYSDLDLQGLDHYKMILLVGPIGSGKSSIGEAIFYALFGKGREVLGSLVREGSDGDTWVEIEGSLGKKVNFVLRRGTKGKASYATLSVNGKEKASGSGVSEMMADLLGYGPDLFLLTDFFGMESADSLLRGNPTSRLETFEGIVNVLIWQQFSDGANQKLKDVGSDMLDLEKEINVLSASLDDLKESPPQPDKVKRELEETESSIEKLNKNLSLIESQSEKQSALLVEKKTLENEVASDNKALKEARATLLSLSRNYTAEKKEESTLLSELHAWKLKSSQRSLEEIGVEIEGCTSNMIGVQTLLSLREQGSKVMTDRKGSCPLCGEKLDEHKMDTWRAETKSLKEKHADLKKKLSLLEKDKQIEKRIDELTIEAKSKKNEIFSLLEEMEELKRDIKEHSQELASNEVRLKTIEKEVGSSERTVQTKEIQRLISSQSEKLGSLKVKLEEERKKIVAIEKQKRKRVSYLRKLAMLRKEQDSLRIVAKAFSRYGIPLELTRLARNRIEVESSNIITRFFSGRVTTVDTEERGKPGISFVLENDNALRPYSLLSEGQKACFYFSIRTAIAHLLTDARAKGLGAMFLDELTTHLDAEARNTLVQTVREVMLKSRHQVFMTSHAPLRNMFDASIQVKIENGISKAVIVEN